MDELFCSLLVVRAGTQLCALPVADICEVMRPLPISVIEPAPHGVLGTAIIRGSLVPVLDLGVTIGSPIKSAGRFVTLRFEQRSVALAVDAVLGLKTLSSSIWESLPPLLGGAKRDPIDALAVLDGELMLRLQTARILSDEVWQVISSRGAVQ